MAPDNRHPKYEAWLTALDAMLDAEEAWAESKMRKAPNAPALRRGRDEAREAYMRVAEEL